MKEHLFLIEKTQRSLRWLLIARLASEDCRSLILEKGILNFVLRHEGSTGSLTHLCSLISLSVNSVSVD